MAYNDCILSSGLSFCSLFAVSIGQNLYVPVFYIALKVIKFLMRIEDGLMGIEKFISVCITSGDTQSSQASSSTIYQRIT